MMNKENLLSTSGPSSPSNLSSVTLVGSTGSGSVDKVDDTPTEEKKFPYGKAPKSPLPERKFARSLVKDMKELIAKEEREDQCIVISETTTNVQPPTPVETPNETPSIVGLGPVEIYHNGHSSSSTSIVAISSSSPSISPTKSLSNTIQTAMASSAATAIAIVPHSQHSTTTHVSPPPSAIIISPSKTTNFASTINQQQQTATIGHAPQTVIITTSPQSQQQQQQTISPPHLSAQMDRRPSTGLAANVIPHAALCQHRYSLQLNGDGGVKVSVNKHSKTLFLVIFYT